MLGLPKTAASDKCYCDACFTGDYPNADTGIDLLNGGGEKLEK